MNEVTLENKDTFFSRHSDMNNIFYDSDIKVLKRNFDEMKRLFDTMFKRYERKETVKIARSVFDYQVREDALNTNPEYFYRFRDDDTVIQVEHSKDGFVLVCIGSSFDMHFVLDIKRNDSRLLPDGSILFDSLRDAVGAYHMVVKSYLVQSLGALF